MVPLRVTPATEPPVIDAHGHTLDQAFDTRRHLHEALGGLTDVPMMRAGGVAAQLTACWVPDAAIGGPHASRQPLRKLLQMVDYLHQELNGPAGDHVTLAACAGDIEAARADGKVALILGLEGGDALKGDVSLLRTLHRIGMRHVGLVHEGRNALGTATQVWDGPEMRVHDSDVDGPGGLTPAGQAIIGEMNRLGMLVDVTHMEAATFRDTLAITTAPSSRLTATRGRCATRPATSTTISSAPSPRPAASSVPARPRSGRPPKRPLSSCCSTTSITWWRWWGRITSGSAPTFSVR